jgi:hypothetical protein
VLSPLEAEVESEVMPAFVVERPVDRDATPLALVLMPDEAEVESEPTELFVDDSPVESEVSLL